MAGGGLWLIRQGGKAEKEGGREIDKASYSLLSLSPKPKALSR